MNQLSTFRASNDEVKQAVQGAHLHPRVERALLDMIDGSPGEYYGAQQLLTDAGAVDVVAFNTLLTTTTASAITLADGTYRGQRKRIQMIVDVGTATLTPANLNGGTTIAFADVGAVAELLWDGSAWQAIALYSVLGGALIPTLA